MTDSTQIPRPLVGLKARGRAFWTATLTTFVLAPHEIGLLAEACRTLDRLDALDAALRKHGPISDAGIANPCLVEARQQAIALSRIFASLRLPEDTATAGGKLERPQRRGSARGVYSIAGGRTG